MPSRSRLLLLVSIVLALRIGAGAAYHITERKLAKEPSPLISVTEGTHECTLRSLTVGPL